MFMYNPPIPLNQPLRTTTGYSLAKRGEIGAGLRRFGRQASNMTESKSVSAVGEG